MIKETEFPLIISPNLGCPEIISVEELKNSKMIPLIIAGQYGEFISPLRAIFEEIFYLRPSDGEAVKIPLQIQDGPKEITDWNSLFEFSDIWSTRKVINSELHYNIFGEETRYWRINVSIKDNYDALLRKKDGRYLPRLFDLVLADKTKEWEKINYHSIQFIKDFKEEFNFIHLTDLHTARRNDEILGEVLKVKSESGRVRKEIVKSYKNFNDRFREFIRQANRMANNGDLDFVVMTGDLVDFAFHGWEDDPNPAENNWKTFINMVTGAGNENAKENPGIKVAIFTSTGNHDWRLHPYNPNLKSCRKTFGLEKKELKHYNYKSFDSTEYPEDERAKLSEKIMSDAFKKLQIDAFLDKGMIRLTQSINRKFTKYVLYVMTGLGLGGAGVTAGMKRFISLGLIVLTGLLVWGGKKYIERKTRKLVDIIIDNPLHADIKALNYYLKHINPYLDYAFQYGEHSFIVMDTGADVFAGRLLDGKEIKDIKKMSIEDNILGGSPDSRAFDSEQNFYNWSQILWLEKVLSTIVHKTNGRGKTFIFLHAPPINPPDREDFHITQLWECNRKGHPKWISKLDCNLTYGTINHYLSQFFYLCMGYRESELVEKEVQSSLRKVDLVFSGHAHRNIEFRIDKEWVDRDNKHEIRIYSDLYSQLLSGNNPDEWWNGYRPVIVQTASCGPDGTVDRKPPYFRKVTIDGDGWIKDFRVMNIGGVVEF